MIIPFNKPFIPSNSREFIDLVLDSNHISGNGEFTKKCHNFFCERYDFRKVLLTSSCTDALEMCALMLNISPGDEVIVPSYTFVTSASAFVRQGAKIVLADSNFENPNVSLDSISTRINENTKAILVVHYAGMAVDMNALYELISGTDIIIIEDAAHAIDSYFSNKPLGGIGHFGVFSFHQTKNISSGEGGLLIINDEKYFDKADIIWEKGTNRKSFNDGVVDKYEWVDIGSSFLSSELNAALLWSQLLILDKIQNKRIRIWDTYATLLEPLNKRKLITIPLGNDDISQNGHTFYFYTSSKEERDRLILHLNKYGIQAYFHYTPLHMTEYYKNNYPSINLPNAEYHGECLLRLPLYTEMKKEEIEYVVNHVMEYYN